MEKWAEYENLIKSFVRNNEMTSHWQVNKEALCEVEERFKGKRFKARRLSCIYGCINTRQNLRSQNRIWIAKIVWQMAWNCSLRQPFLICWLYVFNVFASFPADKAVTWAASLTFFQNLLTFPCRWSFHWNCPMFDSIICECNDEFRTKNWLSVLLCVSCRDS